MIPLLATAILGGANSAFGAWNKIDLSNEQMDRSEQLREDSKNTPKPELRPEFRSAERMREMAYLRGMPGMKAYQSGIDNNTANMAAKGREAASSGGDYLTYLSALYGGSNKEYQQLFNKSAAYKAQAGGDLANTEWAIGQEEKQNEAIQRRKQDELTKQANDLETAASSNKRMGIQEAFGAVTGGLTSLLGIGSGMGEGAGNNKGGDYKSFFDQLDKNTQDIPQQQPSTLKMNNDMLSDPFKTDPTIFGGVPVDDVQGSHANEILRELKIDPTGGPDDVRAMQGYLKGLGWYDGAIDGMWGPKTSQGVEQYINHANQGNAPEDFMSYYYQSMVRPK